MSKKILMVVAMSSLMSQFAFAAMCTSEEKAAGKINNYTDNGKTVNCITPKYKVETGQKDVTSCPMSTNLVGGNHESNVKNGSEVKTGSESGVAH
jgi:hypothetical protein